METLKSLKFTRDKALGFLCENLEEIESDDASLIKLLGFSKMSFLKGYLHVNSLQKMCAKVALCKLIKKRLTDLSWETSLESNKKSENTEARKLLQRVLFSGVISES